MTFDAAKPFRLAKEKTPSPRPPRALGSSMSVPQLRATVEVRPRTRALEFLHASSNWKKMVPNGASLHPTTLPAISRVEIYYVDLGEKKEV